MQRAKGFKLKNFPKHLAIIPDGCRRWAIANKVPTIQGHKKGIEVLENIGRWSVENTPIQYYTIYGLSLENLKRPTPVLAYLDNLYAEHFIRLADDEVLHKNKVRVDIVGREDLLSKKLLSAINVARKKTASYDKKFFRIALAYSGRQEIADAAKKALQKGELSEKTISTNLYSDAPDPDLLIRTAEKRISNFLLWGSAYTELYFVDKFWPAFTKQDYIKALQNFSARARRFGGY